MVVPVYRRATLSVFHPVIRMMASTAVPYKDYVKEPPTRKECMVYWGGIPVTRRWCCNHAGI